MANKTPLSRRIKAVLWNEYTGCMLGLLIIIAIPICLVFGAISGIPGDISRWVKSFEFPAIEARYKTVADQITAATSDTFIDESHSIGHAQLMTHDDFTGVVVGDVIKVFGTDRPFDAVLDDYIRFLSSRQEWKINKADYFLARNTSGTAKARIEVLDKIERYTAERQKYRTVYRVELIYGEPGLWEG